MSDLRMQPKSGSQLRGSRTIGTIPHSAAELSLRGRRNPSAHLRQNASAVSLSPSGAASDGIFTPTLVDRSAEAHVDYAIDPSPRSARINTARVLAQPDRARRDASVGKAPDDHRRPG